MILCESGPEIISNMLLSQKRYLTKSKVVYIKHGNFEQCFLIFCKIMSKFIQF